MDYSYYLTLKKGVQSWILFALGFLAFSGWDVVAQWRELTLGAVLLMLLNYLKNRWRVKII